jgi:hypothetical protein
MINFSSLCGMGRLGAYTKQLSMQNKWDRKKDSGNVLQKEYKTDAGRAMAAKKAAEKKMMELYKQQQEERDTYLEEIHNKLAAGENISQDELEYLREKDPHTYEKIKSEMQEADALKKRLENAKTKEEAQKILQDHTNKSLYVVKSVDNNPNISEEDKAVILAGELRKVKKAAEVFEKFRQTGVYEKLPTEEEKQQVEEEIREAEEKERVESAKAPEEKDRPEEKIRPEEKDSPVEKIRPEETAGTEENTKAVKEREKPETVGMPETKKKEFSTAADDRVMKSEHRRKMNVAEAENTETARKVKRAKAKKRFIVGDEGIAGSGGHFSTAENGSLDLHV